MKEGSIVEMNRRAGSRVGGANADNLSKHDSVDAICDVFCIVDEFVLADEKAWVDVDNAEMWLALVKKTLGRSQSPNFGFSLNVLPVSAMKRSCNDDKATVEEAIYDPLGAGLPECRLKNVCGSYDSRLNQLHLEIRLVCQA